MTDLEKPAETPRSKAAKPRAKKKPPTQTAGVTGIDGHGGMGEAPTEEAKPAKPSIDWQKLIALPAFEMFVAEESGNSDHASVTSWVENRRASMGDDKLYDLYAKWHKTKGYWANETPMGEVLDEA